MLIIHSTPFVNRFCLLILAFWLIGLAARLMTSSGFQVDKALQ